MRRTLTVTLVAALALFAGSAYANYCARDVVPATRSWLRTWSSMNGDSPDSERLHHILTVTNMSHEARSSTSPCGTRTRRRPRLRPGADRLRHVADQLPDMIAGNWSAFQTSLIPARPEHRPAGILQRPFEWGPDGRCAYGAPPRTPRRGRVGLPVPQSTDRSSTAGRLPDGPVERHHRRAVRRHRLAGVQDPVRPHPRWLHRHRHTWPERDRHTADWLST